MMKTYSKHASKQYQWGPASMAELDAVVASISRPDEVRIEYSRAYEKNRRMKRLAAKARFDRKRPADYSL